MKQCAISSKCQIGRVLDFMTVSQILAVLALVQYGLVQYFLSIESARVNLIAQIAKSQIVKQIDNGSATAAAIFSQSASQSISLDDDSGNGIEMTEDPSITSIYKKVFFESRSRTFVYNFVLSSR